MNKIPYTFLGSSVFSVIVLDEMKKSGFVPALIVTTPDKPQGRKLTITPNVTKVWAQENGVKCVSTEKLDDVFTSSLSTDEKNLFIVASYGKIIPGKVLDIPVHKTLNIHPSLLPQYRGASPLQSAILNDTKNTGITIMRIDEQMDHGPIVAQKEVVVEQWPRYEAFEEMMAKQGAILLTSILSDWVNGKIKEQPQDHNKATYTKKIEKEEAKIDLQADAYTNFRKIQAYSQWPVAYFSHKNGEKEMKVKVTSASFSGGKLIIEKVIPEGSKEMDYSAFVNGYTK